MITFILYLIGMSLHAIYAYKSYTGVNNSTMLLGSVISLFTGLTYMIIARLSVSNSDLYIKGVIWDSLVGIIFLFILIIFFNISLTKIQICGIILTIIGTILVRL